MLRLREQAPLLILPVIIAPIFLGAFTTAKSGLYFLVGFRWDRYWADLDYALFGADPWIFTHAVVSPQLMLQNDRAVEQRGLEERCCGVFRQLAPYALRVMTVAPCVARISSRIGTPTAPL